MEAGICLLSSSTIGLFDNCKECYASCSVNIRKMQGTAVKVLFSCKECGYHGSWTNQENHGNHYPFNFLVSAAMTVSGIMSFLSVHALVMKYLLRKKISVFISYEIFALIKILSFH